PVVVPADLVELEPRGLPELGRELDHRCVGAEPGREVDNLHGAVGECVGEGPHHGGRHGSTLRREQTAGPRWHSCGVSASFGIGTLDLRMPTARYGVRPPRRTTPATGPTHGT